MNPAVAWSVQVPSDYLGAGGKRPSAPPTPCVRQPSASTPARQAAISSSSYPRGRAAAWNAAWGKSAEVAAADKRLGAHWSSVRADRVGCAGFVGDVGNWQEDRYHNAHFPGDDIGRAYRVGLARYLCLPLCEAGSLCRGLVCSKRRGGQMGAWKRARHDGAHNIVVRLGKAAGLREGVDMDVEVPYLFTRYRPSDRIRPGGQDMHFSRAPPPRRTRP